MPFPTRAIAVATLLLSSASLPAQSTPTDSASRAPAARSTQQAPAPRPWYDRISLRGYAQIRYNRLLETNNRLVCAQCDRSIGNNGGIFIRRGRLIFSGDVNNRVSIYIQPDYASDAAGTSHYLQLRDAYFDLWLDSKKEHRVRIGQSKVPFGFENLQSSSNRLPLDRNDALNSAVPNERDLGAFYYWSSSTAKRYYRILTDSGLKGSGDYGVFGFGVMNGQTANRPEANNSLHSVARFQYPFRLPSGQFVEVGVQGYRGRFVLPSRTTGVAAAPEFADERMAVSFVWHAQPLGVVAEWNWGNGPEYVRSTNSVQNKSLSGGFVQAMYRMRYGSQQFIPFARRQTYTGGKKAEQDARSYAVDESEIGVEWLPTSSFELTTQFTRSNRLMSDAQLPPNYRQKGSFLRVQAQFNY